MSQRRIITAVGDLRRENWEGLCKRCSLCCHEKYVSHTTVTYILDSPCEMLDPETRLCRVYDSRFRSHQRCRRVNLWRAMFASYLPDSCGYVLWAKKYGLRFAVKRKKVYIPDDHPSVKLDDT